MHVVHSHVLLDTCCILNFSASGNLLAILKTIAAQVAVTRTVYDQELLTLQQVNNEENEGASQFKAAVEQGLLTIVDFESEGEEESFVNYAAVLGDDGESSTFAIAVHREWTIATDDKRAISFFRAEAPHIQILSTPEVIKNWSDQTSIAPETLCAVLNTIQDKGHYFPPKEHPLKSWWEVALNHR